ncbi:MAG: DUF4340 domain-containing protein [Saprospiraceae bacterium]|nr:DUF4340 domain-containing protein [Saprospiraceae bacterium]
MKKTLILISILALLSIAYFGLLKEEEQTSGSISVPDRAFIVDNADLINTITIQSIGYPLVHLNKTEGMWILNGQHRADEHIVQNMVSVLSKMHIHYIPPKSQNDMINRSIANTGMQIKTYDKEGSLLTSFIMAGNTNKEDGTYCINDGAKQAYVMSLPMVEGGLRNYFNHETNALRDKAVFRLDPSNIQSVKIDYPKDRKNSFEINRIKGKYEFEVSVNTPEQEGTVSDRLMKDYLKDFNFLMAEYVSNDNPAQDSVKGKLPFAIIEISDKIQGALKLEFFPSLDIFDKNVNTQSIDNLGQVERYFVQTNWNDFFTVQHRLVSKLLKKPDHFY